MQQPYQPDGNGSNPSAVNRPGSQYGILLMDDEESILEPFGKLLSMKGFLIYTACNGEQAVTLYQQAISSKRKIDVVVIDLTIPEGMGGIETVIRLKEIDPDVRAIATTGHFQDCLTDEYKNYGFLEILPKPFTLKELLEVINRVMRTSESP